MANLAFQLIPQCIRDCAFNAAAFAKDEKDRLQLVLKFFCHLNRARCEKMNEQGINVKEASTKLQLPKTQSQRVIGVFDSHAYGTDAARWLCSFDPPGYMCRQLDDVDASLYQLVLQGPNLGLALRHWVATLKWPADLHQPDPQDWGLSWFEMTVSFYLYTGMLFPIRISGSGARSKYVAYHSDEATLLPNSKRNAAQQAVCFRNAMQNLITLFGDNFFPALRAPVAVRCTV